MRLRFASTGLLSTNDRLEKGEVDGVRAKAGGGGIGNEKVGGERKRRANIWVQRFEDSVTEDVDAEVDWVRCAAC